MRITELNGLSILVNEETNEGFVEIESFKDYEDMTLDLKWLNGKFYMPFEQYLRLKVSDGVTWARVRKDSEDGWDRFLFTMPIIGGDSCENISKICTTYTITPIDVIDENTGCNSGSHELIISMM